MNLRIGDLVCCVAHQGLGRIVSAKRAFGLCRVRWSPHCVSEHPKSELLTAGSMVTTKDGQIGRIIALSTSEVKIMRRDYSSSWVPLSDVAIQPPEIGRRVQRGAGK